MEFYKAGKGDKQICTLCQHYCNIAVDKTGICGVNKNVGNKIECLVYGYPAAMNVDPVEKKPLYHFLPKSKTFSIGTVGCNFKCSFCQNHGISQEREINQEKYYSPEQIVKMSILNDCKSISYTYNEPTIFYPYIRDIAILAKKNGLKNIFVSNGFESHEVINDMAGLIDAANIDLKSYDAKYYKKELGGNLEKLKENLKLFKKLGIWIEITTLVIPNLNDSDEELNNIASFIANELGNETPWHLSAFHPDYKMLDRGRTPKETLHKAHDIGKKHGLKYVYMGNAGLENNLNCPTCDTKVLSRVTYQTVVDNRKNGNECPKCNSKLDGVFHTRRDTSFAGSFYSNNCEEIKKQFGYFNHLLENSNFNPNLPFTPRAIIAPHAGYVYSGFTANVAYSLIKKLKPKRVLVIGPSHKVAFHGGSVANYEEYDTPCGEISIDTEYSKQLLEKFDFLNFHPDVHAEHSTETQAPFIRANLPHSRIIEIVYGNIDHTQISEIIDYTLNDNETFIVISTDLSHFYTKEQAGKLDNICLEAIDKLDINTWNRGCEACGRVGVKAMIQSANKHGYQSRLLDYRTSADITKDDQRVVGYVSAILG
jgi:AmmeMemoRadiSam system radical SAM enzyme/AmmeMemoRadiSam system protein B